jgi:hypothetical protein
MTPYKRPAGTRMRVSIVAAKNSEGTSGWALHWTDGIRQRYWVTTRAEADAIKRHLVTGLTLNEALLAVHDGPPR